MKDRLLALLGLIGIGVITRLLPHPPNATPITALAASAREHLGTTWAVVIPVVTMLVSDAIIGFYDWRILLSVYLSFALIGLMTHFLGSGSPLSSKLVFAGAASFVFFLITNFAVWFWSPWYPKSFTGLLYCYLLSLPFLRSMFLGDLCFMTLMHALEHRRVFLPTPSPRTGMIVASH